VSTSVAVVPLGEAVKPTRPRVKPSDYPELPFIGMEHIAAHSMKLLGTVPAKTMKSSAVHFKPGDVLYGRLRPYLNKVYRPSFEGLCSAEFIVLPENDRVDGTYLQYFLNSGAFVRYATHLNAGDRPRVDFDQLAIYKIPLPGKKEQRRAVAEIEKQFSRLDEGIASLKRVRSKAERYRSSVRASVCGNEAPCHPLGSLLREPLRNGHSAKAIDSASGIPTFTLTAVTKGDFSDQNIKHTSAEPNRVRELWVKNGDIFVERSNTPELVGTARLYRGSDDRAIFPDLLIRVRVSAAVLPEWVELCLLSPLLRRYFKSRAQGIAGTMPKINQDVVNEALIPVPPVAMQKQVVAEVERCFSIIADIEAQALNGLARAVCLRHSILARAFHVELGGTYV
jgi:type I restriction enzyme, S subunit